MAQKSTVFKAELQIADMDRNYYGSHSITVARHPSETDERMMMRILAFILNASEALVFAGGLSSSDEPDLWQKDLTGAIDLWIMVGTPDEKLIKKACSRSSRVAIYSYGGSAAGVWWSKLGPCDRLSNLTVINVAQETSQALAKLAERTMKLSVTIQDGLVWLSTADTVLEIGLNRLTTARPR